MKTPSKNLPSTLSLRSLDIACIAAIFLITFAVYLPGLHNPFLGVEIPGLQHSSVFRELDTFAKQFGSFRALLFKPLTMLTFTLQFELFGADPFSFHLFNVLLHLVNTGLIYLIASSFGASRWIAAGVFALHPLQTSVGGLIYGRPYELGTFFFLLSLFIARRIFMGREFTLKHGILVSGLWCLMFLSKQVFVVFPAVVLWFWLCRPGVSPWHLLGQLFSRYLVAASASLTIAILFIVYYAIPYSSTAQVSSRVFFLSQLGNTLEILLSMFLVPYRTALLHSLPWYGDPFSWQVMAGGLLLLALIALAWRKRTSSLGILLGGFILLLIPTNSIFPKDQVVVEWRFYPAMVFFALLWGVAARRLYRSGTQTLFVRLGFCLLLLGYGALASWQVYEYRSIETAYRDVLKLYPESLFALNDLGNHYFRQGDYQQSEELLRRAIIIAPGNTKVRRNLHRVLEHNHPQ